MPMGAPDGRVRPGPPCARPAPEQYVLPPAPAGPLSVAAEASCVSYTRRVYRACILRDMSIPHVLLGLLEVEPRHGYTLKADYDERFGGGRPLRFGQVYATLARLQREGWAQEIAIEAGAGPERRRFAITNSGVQELTSWLSSPQPPTAYDTSVLFAKTVLALSSGRSAADILDAQRAVHLVRMREVTRGRRDGDWTRQLAADFELAHLQADLDWIETAAARISTSGTGGRS